MVDGALPTLKRTKINAKVQKLSQLRLRSFIELFLFTLVNSPYQKEVIERETNQISRKTARTEGNHGLCSLHAIAPSILYLRPPLLDNEGLSQESHKFSSV